MSGKTVSAIVVLVGVATGAAAWWFHSSNPDAAAKTVSIARPEPDPVLSRVVNSPPMAKPRDFFRIITRPTYFTVDESDGSMVDDEVVIGLEVAGEVRAYPINYLNEHEMVREEIGGLPLLVTW
jgi:hypothetical protein